MTHPYVDVIIPHLDDHDRLAECLALLAQQTYPADRTRVLVVDNGSKRPIDDVVARFPRTFAAFAEERGCGSARNRGVALTSGDILAFTDADCRPDPDWLRAGVERLCGGTIDIVGGAIQVFSADPAHPTAVELFDMVFGFEQRRYVCRKRFAAGANIMVPRRVFDAIGPFRDAKWPEDLEWGRRAADMGFRLGFVPEAVVRHPARRNWEQLRGKADRTTWHSRNYFAARGGFRLRWLAYTAAVATPPLWKCLRLLAAPQLTGLDQRRRAMATLFRLRYYRVARMLGYLFEGRP